MKDYIVKTLSTVYVKVLRLFIYLIVSKHGSPDAELQRIEYKCKETKDITPTRDKVSSE